MMVPVVRVACIRMDGQSYGYFLLQGFLLIKGYHSAFLIIISIKSTVHPRRLKKIKSRYRNGRPVGMARGGRGYCTPHTEQLCSRL
jgi:hypothetical protein